MATGFGFCPNCGTAATAAGQKFCPTCGSGLPALVAPAVVPAPAAEPQAQAAPPAEPTPPAEPQAQAAPPPPPPWAQAAAPVTPAAPEFQAAPPPPPWAPAGIPPTAPAYPVPTPIAARPVKSGISPAMAIVAVLLLAAVAAGAYVVTNGSSKTPGPGSFSIVTPPTTAASVVATVNANDPNSIITQVINGGADIKSFHIKIAVTGTIKAAALKDATASSGLQITGDVKLDGTAIEGDVDVTNQAAHLSLTVPAMELLGNLPITGDIVVVNNALYYKVSLLGTKYTKSDLGSLTGGLPVSVPTPGPSALTSLTDRSAQLRAAMQQAGVTATLVGVDQIDGKDANHINISIPLDKLNAEIAAQASTSPAMKIDSASVDFWVYKDSNRLAKIEIKGASASLGALGFTITVTNYDQPVTIAAPAAADINP